MIDCCIQGQCLIHLYFEGRKVVEQEMHQMHKNRQKVEMMLSNFLQRFSPISLQKNFVFSISRLRSRKTRIPITEV